MQGRIPRGGRLLDLQDGFEAAKRLVDRWRRLVEFDDDDVEASEAMDDLWDELAALGLELTRKPAATLDQIVAKVKVWRALAPDDLMDGEQAPLDARIVVSIMDDIERLQAAGGEKS